MKGTWNNLRAIVAGWQMLLAYTIGGDLFFDGMTRIYAELLHVTPRGEQP